jgi:hypothetical protein
VITFINLGHYGQLGNQLFQYATLRAVSEAQGYELRVPMRLDAPKKSGKFELEPLSLACKPLADEDERLFKHRFVESTHAFDPGVFEIPDWTDLLGFFQTEKYFKHLRRELLREFSFRDPIASYASRYIEAVRVRSDGAPLVAVHVRRGDYLLKGDRFRVLSTAWYRSAMDMFTRSRPVFLFFSDDPGWCVENFGGVQDPASIRQRPSVLHVSTPDHWHDMAVMTRCDHFIIANSSFSWWGAWLATAADKIVVAPKPWFGPKMGRDESDIVPEEWRRL